MFKTKIKNYWFIIALIILANVAIFFFFSRRMESFVTTYTVELDSNHGF
jgi:hypothetical protein